MEDEIEIRIITPEVADDVFDLELVRLTEAIEGQDGKLVAHGALGGVHGYGGHWENDVFLMHPFCWCESTDCPWCMGCECPQGSVHYFVDDREVDFQGWMDFYMLHVYGETDLEMKKRGVHSFDLRPEDYDRLSLEANGRRRCKHDKVCKFCCGEGTIKGSIPEKPAPNFWHKESGIKVWWYKWIGRDMEIVGIAETDRPEMFINDCIASLASGNHADWL